MDRSAEDGWEAYCVLSLILVRHTIGGGKKPGKVGGSMQHNAAKIIEWKTSMINLQARTHTRF